MNLKTRFLAVVFGALSATLLAQQSAQTTTTTTTRSVTGSVVQYTPGQTIVLKGADGRTTTYTIPSAVTVPSDIEIGRSVTISTRPASDGSGPAIVTRIETTSVSSEGQTKTTTERMESVPSSQSDQSTQSTETTTTTVTGKVTAFQPRQSITIEQSGRPAVTYVIDPESQLPQDVAIGKTVTVTTHVVKGSPVVRTITTKTVTTETKPQ